MIKAVVIYLFIIAQSFGETSTCKSQAMAAVSEDGKIMILNAKKKGLRKLIHKKYDTITINECNTSKKCCGCHSNLEYYKDKKGEKVFRLLMCSTCVRPEVKQTVFRTRDVNSAVNIREITRIWINNQTRPEAFKIPSFTISSKIEVEKVRPS